MGLPRGALDMGPSERVVRLFTKSEVVTKCGILF
jgi:hypothetical protein